jgi:hypothetical protein
MKNPLKGQARVLNKYGFRTVSSGSIRLKFNVINQGEGLREAPRPKFNYATKTMNETQENSSDSMATLTAVMKAKQYLEKLRALKKFE